jgi:hypothetical protein
MAQDAGVSIWEAVERWTPTELWHRYQEIASHNIPMVVLGGMDALQREARHLHAEITRILIDKLARRELIGSGIAVPLTATSRRSDIRPELWPLLAVDREFQAIVGNGLRFEKVLIREAPSATSSAAEQEQAVPVPQTQPERPVRSRPGRPSIMSEIQAEMRRRAEADRLAPSMRQEAEGLASWARQNLHEDTVPKAKSIEKALGSMYRELMAKKRGDK